MFFQSPSVLTYDEPLFRPPSEAKSAIFQATLGCSFNQCTFCGMYKTKKFKIRPFELVKEEISKTAAVDQTVEKVFIADGDALVLPLSYWQKLTEHLQKSFPNLRRITSYATPQNILRKSEENLRAIHQMGLEMLYMGVESGDPKTLRFIIKGVSREEIITAANKAKSAGFRLSCTGLLGIAGKNHSQIHARESGTLFSAIDPDFIGILIWMPVPGADLMENARAGFEFPDFQPIDVLDSLKELRTLISALEVTNCVFRSNHASNYLPLRATLPEDKAKLLTQLDAAIQDPENASLRPEWLRAT